MEKTEKSLLRSVIVLILLIILSIGTVIYFSRQKIDNLEKENTYLKSCCDSLEDKLEDYLEDDYDDDDEDYEDDSIEAAWACPD